MKSADKDTFGYRLVQILKKLNQGQKLDPKALADEFGVNLRAIQRDLNRLDCAVSVGNADGSQLHTPIEHPFTPISSLVSDE